MDEIHTAKRYKEFELSNLDLQKRVWPYVQSLRKDA
jgi:hypothetical protein